MVQDPLSRLADLLVSDGLFLAVVGTAVGLLTLSGWWALGWLGAAGVLVVSAGAAFALRGRA